MLFRSQEVCTIDLDPAYFKTIQNFDARFPNGAPSLRGARKRPAWMESVRRRSSLEDGRAEIEVVCGKGVYVRSLVRDIGARLGCGAHVEALRRLSIGPFRVSEALSDPPAKSGIFEQS